MSSAFKKPLQIIYWIIIAILCMPCAEILAFWGYLDGLHKARGPATACVYVAVFIALVVAVGRWFSRGKRDTRFLWRGTLIAVLLAGLGWAMHDDPPPELRYTRDLFRVPPEVEPSRAVLLTYAVGGTNSVPSASKKLLDVITWDKTGDAETSPDLTPFEPEIEQLWADMLPARQVIERLDMFPGVCELANDTPIDISTPIPRFIDWRRITQGYCAYALLKAQQNKADEGVRELAKLHSVSRKWLPYSTVLICRMMNIEIINREIWTAQRILRTGKVSPDALAVLQKTFTPLTADDVSVKRSAIAESLAIRGELEKINWPHGIRRLMTISGRQKKSWWAERLEQLAMPFLPFKKNASIAYLQEIYAPIIERGPSGQQLQEQATHWPRSRRNAIGEVFISQVAMPDYSKAWATCQKVKVRSDLLTLEISRRMGHPTEMKDFFRNATYLYDEATQCYFSAGKDGVPGNTDDIRIGK